MNVLVLGGIERVDLAIDALVGSVLVVHPHTHDAQRTLFMSDQLLD